jgi:Iap family predicted aminopeptidase
MKVIDYILENINENKDIVIYEYGNPHEILVVKKGDKEYDLYDLYTKQYVYDTMWLNEIILCEYLENNCVYLQI